MSTHVTVTLHGPQAELVLLMAAERGVDPDVVVSSLVPAAAPLKEYDPVKTALARFIDERVIRDAGASIDYDVALAECAAWLEAGGMAAPSPKAVTIAFGRAGLHRERRRDRGQPIVGARLRA